MLKKLFTGSAKGAAKGATTIAGLYAPNTWREKGWLWRILLIIGTFIAIQVILMLWWSATPAPITAKEALVKYLPAERIDAQGNPKPTKDGQIAETGAALTAMTVHLIDSLQDKPGGYLNNDVTPPGILMDNMPSWEQGVINNLRFLSKDFSSRFSTSGTQTKLDDDLVEAMNKLSNDSIKWMWPSPEDSYDDAARALERYLNRIIDDNKADAQFYARADNLSYFLDVVASNLGSYSQSLSESVGHEVEDTALAGDATAQQTTQVPQQQFKKTPWHQVDNNFYEARGYAWALLQEMRAIQVDFKSVLEDKNATVYVQQLIRELEATQKTVWSPVILNGDGFGVVTNHSLVMASYLARAQSITIELKNLLERG